MYLEYQSSARKDLKLYAFLLAGILFTYAGTTVPSENCDESGRECAPWLIPVAFYLGILASTTSFVLLLKNGNWGSKVDLENHHLIWWDTRKYKEKQHVNFFDIKLIRIKIHSESPDTIQFYDSLGDLLAIPKQEIFPVPLVDWSHALVKNYPHINIEIENS